MEKRSQILDKTHAFIDDINKWSRNNIHEEKLLLNAILIRKEHTLNNCKTILIYPTSLNRKNAAIHGYSRLFMAIHGYSRLVMASVGEFLCRIQVARMNYNVIDTSWSYL